MNPLLHPFDSRVWSESSLGKRSTEVSPLFADRYRGPRRSIELGFHDFWELVTVLGGSGNLIGKPDVVLKPFTVCLIPPGLLHDERSETSLDTIWVGFTAGRIPGNRLPAHKSASVQSRPLAEFMESLWMFSRKTGGAIGPELDGLTATALAWFLRLLSSDAPTEQHSIIEAAIRHMDQHIAEPLSVEAIAGRYGCSAGYFHRLFKSHTGCPPMVYITRARMRHAAMLLQHTDLPVSAVGHQVGYEDPLHFSRRFHQLSGMTPSNYRARSRTNPTFATQRVKAFAL